MANQAFSLGFSKTTPTKKGGTGKRSVQVIQYNWTTTGLNVTIPLNSSVDPNKSLIYINYITSAVPNIGCVVPSFVDGNNIKLSKSSSTAINANFVITVIEFNGVRSKQTVASPTNTAGTESIVAINNVEPTKTTVVPYATSSTSSGNAVFQYACYAYIKTSTTLAVMVGDSSESVTCQVLEFW